MGKFFSGSTTNIIANPYGAAIGGIYRGISNAINSSTPDAPTLASPNALSSTPTQAQASATAAQQNLSGEQTAASTSTVLSSGAGLEDEPTTTSQTLHGS